MQIPPFSTPGRFWRGNLHTHSHRSDGALTPEQVVDAYKRAGYDFVELSDHFLERYDWPITDTRAFRSNNFTTLIGAELHAMGTEVGELWHILAVGLPLDFPARRAGRERPATRRAGARRRRLRRHRPSRLVATDGSATAARSPPRMRWRSTTTAAPSRPIAATGSICSTQLCNEGRRLTAIATDDAHFRNGDHDAFGGFVEVKAESARPARRCSRR